MMRALSGRLGFVILALGLSTTAGTAFWVAALSVDARPIPALVPPGALIYLEARDFHALLNEWQGSNEKRRWLASSNFKVMSMSRLIARLGQAQDEFGDLAGIPVTINLTDQLAGSRSAFAFYNLPKLSFVYVTEMPQNRLDNSTLWRSRTRYKTREVAGISFYLKSSEAGARTIAFTSYKDWFVVSSSEDRMAETLLLLSGTKAGSLATEGWFAGAEKQAPEQGELRLVYDLHALLATPQFRTYWIQQNQTELKEYSAGISDLFRNSDGFEERRAMIRSSAAPGQSADSSLAEALAYAPASSSLYRAWKMPSREQVSGVLEQVTFSEHASKQMFNAPAPEVSTEGGAVGSEGDLEARIDEPPFQGSSADTSIALIDALNAMQPMALLHVQSTMVVQDQVFVMPNDAIVVVCKKPDRALLDQAIGKTHSLQVGELDSLRSSVNGQVVILSRMDLRRSSSAPTISPDVVYTAVYNHGVEWPHYKKLFGVIDTHAANPEMPASKNDPAFFSANLQSLGDSLAGLRRASIVTSESGEGEGGVVRETVRYEIAKP